MLQPKSSIARHPAFTAGSSQDPLSDWFEYPGHQTSDTSAWKRARWGIEPAMVLYPPVDMMADPSPKERIILGAARFEHGGSKKQIELIAAFEKLCHQYPELMSQWRLVLVGGSMPDNPYLQKVERRAAGSFAPIEVHVNVPLAELQSHYARARIFW